MSHIIHSLLQDHTFKKDVHKYYKTEPSYEGQVADSETIDDKNIYLFAKIERSVQAKDPPAHTLLSRAKRKAPKTKKTSKLSTRRPKSSE